MKLSHLILPVIATTLATTQAAVVIENLALGTQSSSLSLSGPTATGFLGINPFPDREIAFSFTTGNYDSYLTQLDFVIAIGKPFLDPIQFTLSTGSAAPGGIDPVVIGSVTPPSSSPTTQTLSLSPGPTILLEENTTYWMHVTVPSGSALYSFQNTNTPVIASNWSLGNTWYRSPGNPWAEINSGPQARIRMNVTPIPESTTSLLGAIGVLLLMRRRR